MPRESGTTLAVYMATGDDKGHFVHFPYDGDPVPISQPNQYGALPIDDRQKLTRTLIVKIHGAVDGNRGDYEWNENYVVTEDHYIDYLSIKPITAVVPTQILAKLRRSHCLFLGYTMRDWNLRVFLKRIWGRAARCQVVGGGTGPGYVRAGALVRFEHRPLRRGLAATRRG